MITVIKRNGNQQPFDEHKLRVSILNAARDAGVQMSDKETKLVAEDVEHLLKALRGEEAVTSSIEIRSLVRTSLVNFGYSQVAELFERGKLADITDIERHRKALEEHRKALETLTNQKIVVVKEKDAPDEETDDKTHLHQSKNPW
ncbi:hypothetical protein ABB02_00715 [Clostridiaceae bacterium JG1575]|nr:hypothetical protein ABB02_00715 [Clostridiaceae bacterium JG1575]